MSSYWRYQCVLEKKNEEMFKNQEKKEHGEVFFVFLINYLISGRYHSLHLKDPSFGLGPMDRPHNERIKAGRADPTHDGFES